MQSVLRKAGETELRGVGLADNDRTGLFQPCDLDRIALSDIILVGYGPETGDRSGYVLQVFDADGDTRQGSRVFARRDTVCQSLGLRHRLFCSNGHERIDNGIDRLYPPDGLLHQIDGSQGL